MHRNKRDRTQQLHLTVTTVVNRFSSCHNLCCLN